VTVAGVTAATVATDVKMYCAQAGYSPACALTAR